MKYIRPVVLSLAVALLLPVSASAATLQSARTIVVSEPVADNLYIAGSDLTIAAPITGDLVASGGTVSVSAPVTGDALLAGGTVQVRKPVTGDVRAVGGELSIDSIVDGDLMVAGGNVSASTSARDTHIAGGTVRVSGSGGDVTVFGADVYLSGTLSGDVTVTASDKIFVAEGTVITGALKYDAPQQISVPATATVGKGVTYTGSSTFLPTNEEAKQFALAGAGVLLVVRIIAIVIAAGVVVGLFPHLASMVVERTILRSPRKSVLFTLLGFAALVVTPVLILFLLISFVGFALALLLAALYILFLVLAYLYAGLIAGAALSKAFFKKDRISWRTAVLGTVALYIVSSVPVVGFLVVSLLTSLALGALIVIAYRAAFGNLSHAAIESEEEDILT